MGELADTSPELGSRQIAVIERAARSRYGYVMPTDYLERRAIRRLVARGMAVQVVTFPDLWRVRTGGEGQ